ncbi:MAG: alkaline phosphatase family protein [archaeon]
MKKVFVLGIDGAMPEKIFDEWLNDLPNIKKLMQRGCYAKLNSTIPPLSVTAWTSMTTGKKPADHGVFEYLYRNHESEVPGKMDLISSFRVKDKRFWELAGEEGKKIISCFVPLTWPAKPYEGILISGAPALTEKGKFAHPPELEEEIKKVLGRDFQVDIRFFRELTKREILEQIKDVTQTHIDVIKHFIKNKEWDLFFGVITGSDRMNHSFWKYCDTQHRKYDPNSEFKDVLKEYYKFLDKSLGEMLELLDDDTQVVILSDHGFTRMHTRVNLSDWLIKEGYLVLKEGLVVDSPKKLENNMIDWTKTKAFAIGAYDGQIFINMKGRDPLGVVKIEEYDLLINELEEKLKNIKGDDGKALNTRTFSKEKYFKGKCENLAPDIVIYFDNLHYGCNSTLVGNKTLWSPHTAMGSDDATHSEQGIFIMDKCKQKGNIGEIDILDIAPTMLDRLGVEIPEELSGKVIR